MDALFFDRVFGLVPQEYKDLAEFQAMHHAAAAGMLPIDAAILGGAMADRLGYAFAAGYRAAVRYLVPEVRRPASLGVTEAGGGRPRDIQSRVEVRGSVLRLRGRKRWATLAGEGEVLLVVASTGWEGERNQLRLVQVPIGTPGLGLTSMPDTPFTPEIPHYSVDMDLELPVEAMLPGDAFTRYVRPFRTVEDTFVGAATAALLMQVRDAATLPRLAALLLTYRQLSFLDPAASTTHIALAGAQQNLEILAEVCAWAGPAAARWARDRALLQVAAGVRAQRLTLALERYDRPFPVEA